MKATDCLFRFSLLPFACLLTFGMFFSFDLPGVLQHRLEGISNCTDEEIRNNESCTQCEGCLGMSSRQFNILYAVYAWTNAVVTVASGIFIDNFGKRVGALLFSFLCFLGTSLFAFGAMLKDTPYMFPLMLAGRLVFGSGGGSLHVVQGTFTAYWFKNKELAFAFACRTAVSSIGSVLNFFVSEMFASQFGLTLALWLGSILCGMSFLSAIIVSLMDIYGVRQIGEDEIIKKEAKSFKLSDLRHFSLTYWCLVVTLTLYFVSLMPFVADASLFIQQKYGYTPRISSIIAGVVYDLSIVLVPIMGLIIDRVGKRGILVLVCSIMVMPAYVVLAFTYIHPLIATVWLGVTYSLAGAVIWPAIPLLVKQSMLGTAMGINNSMQMLGVGFANLVVGEILGKNNSLSVEERLNRWKIVMIFFLGTSFACFTGAVFVNISDFKRDGILNRGKINSDDEKTVSSGIGENNSNSYNHDNGDRGSDCDEEKEPLLTHENKSVN